jgi:hypothetical protein
MLENSYKPQELLSDIILDLYVCGLENNKENINLLKQLRTMSGKIPSKHIKNNYKQARLEQYFYYRRVAKEREPHMIERLKKDMQKIRGGVGK